MMMKHNGDLIWQNRCIYMYAMNEWNLFAYIFTIKWGKHCKYQKIYCNQLHTIKHATDVYIF